MHLESPGLIPGSGVGPKKLYFQSLSATSDSRAKFEPSSLSSPGQVYHTTSKSEGEDGPIHT